MVRRRAAAVTAALVAIGLSGCGSDTATNAGPGAASAPATATTGTPTSAPVSPLPEAVTSGPATPAPAVPNQATVTPASPVVVEPDLPPLPVEGPPVPDPGNAPAVGRGANAVVALVPDDLWGRMVGTSWTPGCPVGRTGLRAVSVNFWAFDGRRSRGTVVVATRIADRTAAAFAALYAQQFRIRSLRPMDSTWGANPKGPGADDYAAMRADNTSGFNCRYVGGQEAERTWSRHAYGLAVDVNDLENPYVADDGTVYPDPYFLTRRTGPGTFSSAGSPAVRAFTSRGFRWGGLWSHPDFQHMEFR